MKTFLARLTLIVSLAIAPFTHAAWYEVSASSPILESQQAARMRALEAATFDAIQFAGADVGSLQQLKRFYSQVKPGYQFSGNAVREVQVLEEGTQGGNYVVNLRLDIYPSANACHKTQYRKGIVLTRFPIISPQQAALGGIYQFGDDFSVLLNREIKQHAQSFVGRGIANVDISPNRPRAASMLAEDKDAQFVVTGAITDLSATTESPRFSEAQNNRQLAINVQAMDSESGEVIFQRRYRDVAQWPFERHSQVDTQTARFWQSPYGQMARRMSRNILLDLESSLACRASKPKIVSLKESIAQINVGRINGVKQGDQLNLWHVASFTDDLGIVRTQRRKSGITLTVARVYESSAEAVVQPNNLTGSIQIGDIVTKGVN
ncbi:flagella assembly protein FlgT [Salinivibrio sp. ES.052]|uniref:flagella assembly protein FlgT n=1 Tax=Salinivibrio sp. ES.052 TaxID=1882823 RepID=UPI0009265C1F|nr:flagella assembly protein FlgT [Salinivibrio sp. ES.052]SIN75024.1 Flagellar assembly protein T, N-terminal domain [Salinivibrio sp. ES.052]